MPTDWAPVEQFPSLARLERLERASLRLEGALFVWCLWVAAVLLWRWLGGAA